MCVWYLLSVSGIDIHTDTHDGRSYVVPLFSGISCERIHPEDDCHCCHIHHHLRSCECGLDEQEDCSDRICVVDISGFNVMQLHCPAAGVAEVAPALFPPIHDAPSHVGCRPVLSCGPPPDILLQICTLRV